MLSTLSVSHLSKPCSVLQDDKYDYVLSLLHLSRARNKDERNAWNRAQKIFSERQLAGGSSVLLRTAGHHVEQFHAERGEYPLAVRQSELFNILWDLHQATGHMRSKHQLVQR